MGGKAAGQPRPGLGDLARPWEAARSVTLILSRSKFPQGTAGNMTLVGRCGCWASWPRSGGGHTEARHLSSVPGTAGQQPREGAGHTYTHLLQPQTQPFPQIKGHTGRLGSWLQALLFQTPQELQSSQDPWSSAPCISPSMSVLNHPLPHLSTASISDTLRVHLSLSPSHCVCFSVFAPFCLSSPHFSAFFDPLGPCILVSFHLSLSP